jgi:hydrogenase/urease accessory protein HupE
MKKIAFLPVMLLPVLAMAHPGHGPVDHGLAHYLTSPIHLLGIVAALVLVGVVYRYYRSQKRHA